jgi:ABC-type glycerol-3-phosphate transport system substrate-binding protein
MYPVNVWIVTAIVNETLAKELGVYDMLPLSGDRTWTIAQAEALAKAVKEKGGKFGVLHTAGSGDYYMDGWAIAFGGSLYLNNDYSEPAMNTPEWKQAWTWLKTMQDEGYFVGESWTFTDDTYYAEGPKTVLNGGSYSQVRDGASLRVVSYPSPDGSFVPFQTAPSGIMVFDHVKRLTARGASSTEISKAQEKQDEAVKFAMWLNNNVEFVKLQVGTEFSWRTDIVVNHITDSLTPENKALMELDAPWLDAMIAKYGLADIGIASPKYQALRGIKSKHLGLYLSGVETVDDALKAIVTEFKAE